MSNLKLLKILNPIMALAFIAVASCAIIMMFRLLPALIDTGLILTIHMTAGKIFILCGLCHIILNWTWIKTQIFGIKPAKKTKKK